MRAEDHAAEEELALAGVSSVEVGSIFGEIAQLSSSLLVIRTSKGGGDTIGEQLFTIIFRN